LTAAAAPLSVATIEFDAPAVARTMKYQIIVPDGYEVSEERYPVLYLLHGLTSNYTAWARMRVPEYAARYKMIVVMPDVGNSWYVNWAESGDGQKNAWEDYMINDVIGHVDKNYRTIAKREGRAINGLSMGGFGGIMLGLRHPEMFCSIASHSGALSYASGWRRRIESTSDSSGRQRREPSTRPNRGIDIEGFSSPAERTPSGKPFVTVEDCDNYDPFKLVLQVPKEDLPHIHIDCGTEDRLIASARSFVKVLQENTIPYSYAESTGGHRPDYWAREVAHSMSVQYNVIQRNLAEIAKESN
jgi:S-formylglutathione hydrolase FrmB